MKTATVKRGQTIFDMAVEQYGNCEAWAEILANNPELENGEYDKPSPEGAHLEDFFIDGLIAAGNRYTIDTDSPLRRVSVMRQLENEITTFDMD